MHWKQKKFWRILGIDNPENFKLDMVKKEPFVCICGTKIKYKYFISSREKKLIIGRCCAEKLGLKLKWKTQAEYLNSAIVLAKTAWEKKFTVSIDNKLSKYPNSVIISKKQADILKDITGKNWRWQTWTMWNS